MSENRQAAVEPRRRPELRTTIVELLETLRDARAAVDREREVVLVTSAESERFRRLHQSLRSFSSFADRLLVLMSDRGLDGPLMDEAEQLYDFFCCMEAEIGDWLPPNEI